MPTTSSTRARRWNHKTSRIDELVTLLVEAGLFVQLKHGGSDSGNGWLAVSLDGKELVRSTTCSTIATRQAARDALANGGGDPRRSAKGVSRDLGLTCGGIIFASGCNMWQP